MSNGSQLAVLPMTPQRALLQEIIRDNMQRGLNKAIQLPGYIRSEVPLTQGNSINFPIGVNEQVAGLAISPTENRLAINDAFYITHIAVMFQTFTTATAGARNRAIPETFPNAQVFTDNAPSIRAAYNGKLALRVDETVYIDSLDMMRFMNARQAQKGLAVSAVASTGVVSSSDFSQNEAFSFSVDPLVRLNGPGRNNFTVTLPDNVDFQLVDTETVVAVLYLRGWLSQNGGSMRSGQQ